MKEIKKILCAVDLAEYSAQVAEYAALLAKACHASVLAIYTAPSLSQYVGFHVPPTTIENFVKGVEAEGRVVVGYAAEEILKTAAKENCDLIVMGTHGRKGIDRILFGSVAEKVVKRSPVPVLTIRPHAVSGTEGK